MASTPRLARRQAARGDARSPRRIRPGRRAAIGAGLLLAASGAWWVALHWPASWLPREPRRALNLIVVTADTLRADRLGAYGNRRIATPHLDRLAAEGVLFEQATTVVPLTLPAHASIFTGTYPLFHGVRDNGGYYLEPEQVTLAEVLKAHGYVTGAFVGAFVLDSRWGLDQGFDRYVDDFQLSKYETVSLDSVQRRGDEVLDRALRWLDSVRERRFFAWLHFYDAHTPYDPPEPFLSRYGGVRWGRYDGEVAWVDSLMGRLLGWIDERGLRGSTLVAFVGDHGESLGEHEETTHGFFVYDATLHVPFIVRAPYRDLAGRRVAQQVRVIDLMPTLLDLVGVPIPPAVQGVSLVELAAGRAPDPGLVAYAESYYPRHHYGWSELKALRDGAFLFVAAPRPELYDLEADPAQRHNLAPERPTTVSRYAAELDAIVARYSAAGAAEKRPQLVDPDTQAQLAALGYIAGPAKVRVEAGGALADPKDKIQLFNLIKEAGADSSEGRIDSALEKIQRVLAADPDILEAHLILGNLYGKRRDWPRAMAAYKAALARDETYLPALFSLAAVYKEVGRTAEAAAGFRRLIELDPRDNRAYFMLAQIHAEQKQFDAALALLQRAVDVGSERAPLHNLMAECYIELKRYDEAERELDRALTLNPELPTAHYNLALIREARGDLAGAAEAYERELAIVPRSYKAHFNLAKLYGRLGRSDGMLAHFERAVELMPTFALGHLYLAKAYLDRGDLARALDLTRKGLALKVEEPAMAPFGHFLLADIYNRLGRFADAERELAVARRLQGS
jgi:choline-sulfatase